MLTTTSIFVGAGLITKILPKENFMDEVIRIARRIADKPSGSLQANKNLMMEPIRQELLAANDRECAELRERAKTDEPRRAIQAYEREQKARRKEQKPAKL